MSNYLKRREQLSGTLENETNTSILLTNPKNIYYFTGFLSDPHERFMGLFWNQKSGWTLILPKLDIEAARQVLDPVIEVIGFSDSEPAQALVRTWLEKTGAKEIAVEQNVLTYDRLLWLQAAENNIKISDIAPVINQIRAVKSEEEQSLLKQAGALTDEVLKAALTHFKRGITESDLVAEIEYQAKKRGAEEMSFGTTVLVQEKSAMPHGNPADRKLDSGVLLIDFGLVLNGYCSDMTRVFHIGPWEEQMKKVYETVLRAEKSAIEQASIHMTYAQVDAIARNIITEAGFGEYFIHRLGHGIGLDIHEYPSVAEGNEDTVQEGVVFTIEPGIYIPGLGGVRIEDAVIITAQGAQTLTHFPKEVDEVVIE